MVNGNIRLGLTRGVTGSMREEKNEIANILMKYPFIIGQNDSVFWELDNKGVYTVQSMYNS